ncbi:hypothetical protein HZS_4908 [Henneguya salminicola]|nr:hypothetical protein HZS_4908 [Henneguya salminicola]
MKFLKYLNNVGVSVISGTEFHTISDESMSDLINTNILSCCACINPFYVSTKMSKVRSGFGIPTPEEYALSSIDTFEYNVYCVMHSTLFYN